MALESCEKWTDTTMTKDTGGKVTLKSLNHHQQLIKLLNEHFGGYPVTGIEIGTSCGDLVRNLIINKVGVQKIYTIDPWVHVEGKQFENKPYLTS